MTKKEDPSVERPTSTEAEKPASAPILAGAVFSVALQRLPWAVALRRAARRPKRQETAISAASGAELDAGVARERQDDRRDLRRETAASTTCSVISRV